MRAEPQSRTKPSVPTPALVAGGILQRKCACGGSPGADGECAECRRKRLHGKGVGDDGLTEAPPIVHDVLSSPGRPLEEATRNFMEPRLGHDFSRVRVHTDARAAASARAVHAQAYAVGDHVVFGTGSYAPATDPGRHLLAHELAHVAMNAATPEAAPTGLRISQPGDRCEREADRAASLLQQTSPHQGRNLAPEPGIGAAGARATLFRAPLEQKPATASKGGCGPDVTAWLAGQMAAARSNPSVLSVAASLSRADAYGRKAGLSAKDVVEGGLKVMVERAAQNIEKWPPKADPKAAKAKSQLDAADPEDQLGQAVWQAWGQVSTTYDPVNSTTSMFWWLYKASSLWRDLVKTKGPFDFKNNRLQATNLAGYCPEPCKASDHPTVTLCRFCFDRGLPGNIFFGHIGRFCGFTLSALQLGSQWANLKPGGGKDWDSLDDIAGVELGFNLPAKAAVSESSLCSAVGGQKTSLANQAGCAPCSRALRSSGAGGTW